MSTSISAQCHTFIRVVVTLLAYYKNIEKAAAILGRESLIRIEITSNRLHSLTTTTTVLNGVRVVAPIKNN